MGKTRGPGREEYPIGTVVRIADRATLEHVMQTWKYHHKLHPEQLAYAGQTAVVRDFAFYHGGDELYCWKTFPVLGMNNVCRANPMLMSVRLRRMTGAG
jgi:hypothetical protein